MKKLTGIFGGSFSPIHNGHINLARYVVEQGFADEVWLMVSPHNPLKQQDGLMPEAQRLQLARLAVENVRGVEVSDFEFSLPRPSYTWQTLRALEAAYPDRRFALIIGADNWQIFPRWARHEELISRYPILIYPREGSPLDAAMLPPSMRLMNAPLFPWSSTEVRRRLAEGESVDEMLPPSVVEALRH